MKQYRDNKRVHHGDAPSLFCRGMIWCKDATYDVDTGYLTVHIQVQDGAARFVDSPCPDHICEHYGWLREEDQTATCLPARAVLTIVPVS